MTGEDFDLTNGEDDVDRFINEDAHRALVSSMASGWRRESILGSLNELGQACRDVHPKHGAGELLRDIVRGYDVVGQYSFPRKDFIEDAGFKDAAYSRYFALLDHIVVAQYLSSPRRLPRNFRSNREARDELMKWADIYRQNKVNASGGRKNVDSIKFNLRECVDMLIDAGIAITCAPSDNGASFTTLFYDYDHRIYTPHPVVANMWMVAINGEVTRQMVDSLIETIIGRPDDFAIYMPPPVWKIAVGNGLYDVMLHKLTPSSPFWTVTRRVATRYVPDAVEPALPSGMTFERLVNDLANNNPKRVSLIKQMCKTIVLGYVEHPACFVMVGRGGDGKSLFMKLMCNIVGRSNTATLCIKDFSAEDKLLECVDAALVVGFDNDSRSRVKDTTHFKSLVTNDPITLSRKFMRAASVRFNGVMVQLCNAMPRIVEPGGDAASIKRRVIAISAENSHYERSNEITSLSAEIEDRGWHEYILKYLLDEMNVPYFTDYNDVDASMLITALHGEDIVGQFIKELHNQGVILPSTKTIPLNLLFAVYSDWVSIANPSGGVMSLTTFKQRIAAALEIYGFTKLNGVSTLPLNQVMSAPNSVGMNNIAKMQGPVVDKYLRNNLSTEILERSKESSVDKLNLGGARVSKACSPRDYFSIDARVDEFIEKNPFMFCDLVGPDMRLKDNLDEVDMVDVDSVRSRWAGDVTLRESLARQAEDSEGPSLGILDVLNRKVEATPSGVAETNPTPNGDDKPVTNDASDDGGNNEPDRVDVEPEVKGTHSNLPVEGASFPEPKAPIGALSDVELRDYVHEVAASVDAALSAPGDTSTHDYYFCQILVNEVANRGMGGSQTDVKIVNLAADISRMSNLRNAFKKCLRLVDLLAKGGR